MNRRKFFAFLPVAPVAFVTEGAKADNKDQRPHDSELTLSISGHKPPKPAKSANACISISRSEPTNQVSMAVGQDGKLWLRTNSGEWKKVVTE